MKSIFFSLLLISTASCQQDKGALVNVCYVPFGLETFTAMTTKNISSHCSVSEEIILTIDEHKELMKIFSVAPSGVFNDQRVRLKIQLSGDSDIYIDNDGGFVMSDQKGSRVIPRSELVKIKSILHLKSKL
jgi:hypothetical protein